MFNNLLKYSLRALGRQKSHVVINIIGLSVGMVCSMVIALFIIHELSYDKFNEKIERIYRVILNGKLGGQEVKVTYTAAPIGPTMKNEFPEVEDFLRMNNWDETIIRYVLSLASLFLAIIVTVIILPYINNLLEIKMKADQYWSLIFLPDSWSPSRSPWQPSATGR